MITTFTDSDYWQELANFYLPRYNLPDFTVGCTVEAMKTWLDRLDIDFKVYEKDMNTRLADFCQLNPDWPLRGFIGLALEYKHGTKGPDQSASSDSGSNHRT